MRKEVTDWEKILQKTYVIQELYSKYMLTTKRQKNNQIKQWANDLNRHLTKEDIHRWQISI